MTLLRTTGQNEIWCRCDGGPHGYLSIAAHSHADALSVEVRYAGVDILADPGTYCYHGERAWRSYFRSTIAHNTAELGGRSQSSERGPFTGYVMRMLARSRYSMTATSPDGRLSTTGTPRLTRPRLHRRSVLLDRASRSVDIIDEIDGGSHDIRLAFHLGPEVQAGTSRSPAQSWAGLPHPHPGTARLELPPGLRWSLHRGESDPILGWYSPGLGRRVPAFTLLGCGRCVPGMPLITPAGVPRSRQVG